MTVIALWAHPRSVSTAFLRMMAERGDVTVVHEPLVLLTDHGQVTVPAVDDGDAADDAGRARSRSARPPSSCPS